MKICSNRFLQGFHHLFTDSRGDIRCEEMPKSSKGSGNTVVQGGSPLEMIRKDFSKAVESLVRLVKISLGATATSRRNEKGESSVSPLKHMPSGSRSSSYPEFSL